MLDLLSTAFYSQGNLKELLVNQAAFYIELVENSEKKYLVHGTKTDDPNVEWSFSFTELPSTNNGDQIQYNAFVKSAVDKLPIDVVIYDKNLHFAYMNEVAVKDATLRKWLIGKSIEDYVAYRGLPNEHGVSRRSFFTSIMEDKEPVNWIDEYYFKDGGEKFMLRNYYPYIVDGEVQFLFGCGVDISKQVEIEKQSKLLIEDLTVRNKLLSQFSHIISHNLRSHSANLMGLSQFFDYVRNDPSKLDDVLSKMSSVTIDLDATLRDLNTIVNIEKGDEAPSKMDLDVLLDEIYSEVKDEIPKAASVILDRELTIQRVQANRANLKSVLKSLIANGVKFSKDNKNAKVIVRCHYQDSKVVLTVEDNGIGIDTIKNKKRLFELYQRFSPSYADGRGIGLFLVKSQVHSMKGSIDIKSKVGTGTTFTIKLPQETYIREENVTVSTRI